LEADFRQLSGTSVYVLKDAQGTVLYVGEGNVFERLRAHLSDPGKTPWFGEIAQIEVRGTGLTKKQSLALEEDLIHQLQPLHNKQMTPFMDAYPGSLRGPDLPGGQRTLSFDVHLGRRR
jgi:excinuclease UvrABC nuclease subunit